MNWVPYSDFKDSGAAWVGRVPMHWTVGKVKHGFSVTLGKMYQGERASARDVLVPHLKAGSLTNSGVDLTSPMQCWFSPGELSVLSLRKNDLLVAEGGSIGRCAILSEDLPQWGFQKSLNRVRVRGNDDIRFLSYLVQCATECGHVGVLCGRSTIQHFTSEKLANLEWPHPSPREQREISAFLDRETAKIDALIARQEQLIDTLREDRTATVTHAVTKGIDPDVEMKETDVEWLDAIPKHWRQSHVKYACSALSGYPFKSGGFSNDPRDVRLLRGVNVGVNQIGWDDVVYWPKLEIGALVGYALESGDIVMGLDRPFISTGIRVARVTEADVPSLLLQRVLRLRAKPDFDQDYLSYVLSGPSIIHHLAPMFTGVSVPHVSPDQVGSLPIPQPPLAEQREIVEHLVNRCDRLDSLLAKAAEVIDTLREYRSALVADVVTGKIDVRGAA